MPHPLAPTRPTVSLGSTLKFASTSRSRSPTVMRTSLRSITAPAVSPRGISGDSAEARGATARMRRRRRREKTKTRGGSPARVGTREVRPRDAPRGAIASARTSREGTTRRTCRWGRGARPDQWTRYPERQRDERRLSSERDLGCARVFVDPRHASSRAAKSRRRFAGVPSGPVRGTSASHLSPSPPDIARARARTSSAYRGLGRARSPSPSRASASRRPASERLVRG